MKQNTLIALVLLSSLLCSVHHSYSQQNQIDSLKNELARFDRKKKVSGTTASSSADTAKINILRMLIAEYFQNDPRRSFPYIEEELRLSEKLNYRSGLGDAYAHLGSYSDYKTDYKLALRYYRTSLAIRHEIGDTVGILECYSNIGTVYATLGNYPESLFNLMKALEIAKKLDDKHWLAAIYNNLGVLHKNQNNYTEALKNYVSCIKVIEDIHDDATASVMYNNIGEIYLLQNKPGLALASRLKGLKLAKMAGNKGTMANNYTGIGEYYQYMENYPKALENYSIALRLSTEIDDSTGIIASNLAVGYALYKLGNHTKAIEHTNKALNAAKNNGQLIGMQQAYQSLSEIYETLANYRLAFENYKLYKQTTDSMFTAEKEKKFSLLQIRYDYKSMQDSIRSVQDKKDIIVMDEIKNQRITRNFIFFTLGLVIVFFTILLIQRNKLAAIKREKALAQERNRISRDLHDNLGAQLSTARMFISNLKNGNENVSETVDNTIELLDDSILELRKIMNETNASVLNESGFLAATEQLANKLNQLHLIHFTLTHHNMEKRPDKKIEHELFRITQELVNNSLKYSEAGNITIDVLKRDGNLILMYEDDGKGFNISKAIKGNGLTNIVTRAQSVNGTVEFDSAPGAGARTIVEIPLNA
jgi:two-component system, NarL family, sensor kinase